MHKEIILQDGRGYWAVAVEYTTGDAASPGKTMAARKRIDYKDELSPENFAVFVKLRDWRKTIAGQETVQLYTDFTNSHLAAMVEKKITKVCTAKSLLPTASFNSNPMLFQKFGKKS